MNLIWATRGLNWGFRFVRNDWDSDPLPVYDSVFRAEEEAGAIYRRRGDRVALRFQDPEGRKDRAGRPIFHDFVISGRHLEKIDSIESGVRLVWPLVADKYAEWWNRGEVPHA